MHTRREEDATGASGEKKIESTRERRCLGSLRQQLGGEALCFGDTLDFHRDGVDRLLELIEALFELNGVGQGGLLRLSLQPSDQAYQNTRQCAYHDDDYNSDYREICDIGIHCFLRKKFSAFTTIYVLTAPRFP